MSTIAEQDHQRDLLNILERPELRLIAKQGIIHVGAHEGQEVKHYLSAGFKNVILIEANPSWFRVLRSKFGSESRIKIFNYAICDHEGVADLHIHTSRSGSTEPASILPMKRFNKIVKTLYTKETITVASTTLDILFQKHGLDPRLYNYINIDIQGAELMALEGATTLFPFLDVIISEVNLVEMYERGANEEEIVAFLEKKDFEKRHAVYHTLYDQNSVFPAWGECLFVKRTRLDVPTDRTDGRKHLS